MNQVLDNAGILVHCQHMFSVTVHRQPSGSTGSTSLGNGIPVSVSVLNAIAQPRLTQSDDALIDLRRDGRLPP